MTNSLRPVVIVPPEPVDPTDPVRLKAIFACVSVVGPITLISYMFLGVPPHLLIMPEYKDFCLNEYANSYIAELSPLYTLIC